MKGIVLSAKSLRSKVLTLFYLAQHSTLCMFYKAFVPPNRLELITDGTTRFTSSSCVVFTCFDGSNFTPLKPEMTLSHSGTCVLVCVIVSFKRLWRSAEGA